MEQTAADAPVPAGDAALQPQRPPLPAPAGQQHPAGAGDQGARGEHVHSEPAPPATGAVTPGEPEGSGAAGQVPESRLPGGRPSRFRRARPVKQPERYSVRAQVLKALREALLSGELAPGEVYSAPGLAERLGVSATPVREAMQRLACEGAVETVPNRGFRVAVCSDRDVAELAEIRALLEIPSVLDTARGMPPECWESLRPYADEALTVARRGDRAAYADADCAFHCALLELTGNRQLVAVAADIQRRAQRRPAPAARSLRAEELLRDASDHMVLLDALCDRDLAAVEHLMRAHVTA
ncbi:GntR family transcriptional regulator [Streptomyces sp. WMMB 322]|uniref:GntR family transcriptional regulator n=1 Tax=Streptomyces sp. WMMB 322 TaxID=1286821 RepID=UPI0006E135F5|nr:GntR family transcriptional regulator [Streptomyces sp. WMMB 322]SCK42786.1 DNA-binding transcriptional regulator, GntR family [Streptomyces sp. WMMB 322]